MHIDRVYGDFCQYTVDTVAGHILEKFFYGLVCIFIFGPYESHPFLVTGIVGLYIIDFITGFLKARKLGVISSSAFFKGATKIVVYAVYIFIGVMADHSIADVLQREQINIITPFIFAAIIITDGISILENLDELGYKDKLGILKVLKFVLNYQKRKLFDSQVQQFGGGIMLNIGKDFENARTVLIPAIQIPDIRRMFEIKIDLMETFVFKICELQTIDGEVFKLQFRTLLEQTGRLLEDKLKKANFKEEDVNKFLQRHGIRVIQYKQELTALFEKIDGNHELNEQIKHNIIQATVRIIYNGMGDNIKFAKNENME